MGLATAEQPLGPYTKHSSNAIFDRIYKLEAWTILEACKSWMLIADSAQLDFDK